MTSYKQLVFRSLDNNQTIQAEGIGSTPRAPFTAIQRANYKDFAYHVIISWHNESLVIVKARLKNRAKSPPFSKRMKPTLGIGTALATLGLSLATQAAFVDGAINFSSGGNGGIILQDSFGNMTTDLAVAAGIQTWLLPKVDSSSGSFFISVPDGQAVSFSQPWVFAPSTPMNPLWTIVGVGNFTFTLSSSSVVSQDSDFLLVSGIGILTGDNFDPTPATWDFSTHRVATETKFSWSSSTAAIPEMGTPTLLGGVLLWICFLRRRDLT